MARPRRRSPSWGTPRPWRRSGAWGSASEGRHGPLHYRIGGSAQGSNLPDAAGLRRIGFENRGWHQPTTRFQGATSPEAGHDARTDYSGETSSDVGGLGEGLASDPGSMSEARPRTVACTRCLGRGRRALDSARRGRLRAPRGLGRGPRALDSARGGRLRAPRGLGSPRSSTRECSIPHSGAVHFPRLGLPEVVLPNAEA